MESTQNIILDSTKQLVTLLGYDFKITVDQQDEVYVIQIDCEDTGILIGYHGQTLYALQTILSHIVFKAAGQWVKITLNVSDYWQKREEQLKTLAQRGVEEVRNLKTSYTLPFLSARERRLVHMYLQDMEEIYTESIGEGAERRLVIFPK